ncbi:hypothetical protein H6G03_33675, partial [Planktothrix sp. FACHB-1375]|nr:hypothetical protein [Aerosakkonema funiforme FACHB-1375]
EYSQDGANLQEIYRAADAALYQAKAMGRNRVLVSSTCHHSSTVR